MKNQLIKNEINEPKRIAVNNEYEDEIEGN